jgi:hypothetical protein
MATIKVQKEMYDLTMTKHCGYPEPAKWWNKFRQKLKVVEKI